MPLELRIFSLIIASNISSVPFPLSGIPTFPSCICYTFCNCPIILNILFSSFFTFFSLCYSVWGVSVDITSSSLILSSAVSSLLWALKGILHFCYSVSNISFWFFVSISIPLLTLSICSCLLSTFSIRTLSILILVILNSQSYNSKILVVSNIWLWCLLSQKLCFHLLVCCKIFCWKLDWLKRILVKYTFININKAEGVGRYSIILWLGLTLLGSLHFWVVTFTSTSQSLPHPFSQDG